MEELLNVLLVVFISCAFTFGALGFPRKSVFAGAGIAVAVLALLEVCLSGGPNAYLMVAIGLVLGSVSISARQEKAYWSLVIEGEVFAGLIAISLWQCFMLLGQLDLLTRWILKVLVAGILLYPSIMNKWNLISPDIWLSLWGSRAFRRRQVILLLAQAIWLGILAAMVALLPQNQNLAAGFVLAGGAFFAAFSVQSLRMFVLENENYILRENQESSQKFFHAIRSQRHDFMIHVHTIHGLLLADEVQECRNYVQKLMDETEASNAILPLENPAVSALLGEYLAEAEKQEITLTYSLKNDLAQVACTEFELNRILGNLLNNAFEEVEKYEGNDRWIRLLTIKRGGRSVIKVTNCFRRDPGEVRDAMQMNFTTKSRHEGIGMKNVERIAKKYGGAFFIELDEGEISTIAQIPNQLGGGVK